MLIFLNKMYKEYIENINNISYNIIEGYYDNGNICYKRYYVNNISHNESGPAHILFYENGNIKYKAYLINGQYHNENGPAIIHYNTKGIIIRKYYRLWDRYLDLININSNNKLKQYLKHNYCK